MIKDPNVVKFPQFEQVKLAEPQYWFPATLFKESKTANCERLGQFVQLTTSSVFTPRTPGKTASEESPLHLSQLIKMPKVPATMLW